MLILLGLTLLGVIALVLALRPARRELRLPREEALGEGSDETPSTIDLTAREVDRDERP